MISGFNKNGIIVQMFLCRLYNLNHHLECFQRVFPLCCLSGKHNCICSVVYRIGNIRHFCSCRTRITHHRIQHLCCSNNSLKVVITFLDDHFLEMWHFLCRDLYTKISTCHHDTISRTDNLINILNTFCVLYLCNDWNIRSAEFF